MYKIIILLLYTIIFSESIFGNTCYRSNIQIASYSAHPEYLRSVYAGDFEMLKSIIEDGVNVNHEIAGAIPFAELIDHSSNDSNYDSVKYFLKAGAKVNSCRSSLVYPLITAIEGDNYKIAKLLIENGIDVNAYIKTFDSPLIYAVLYEKDRFIKLLVENGANLNQTSKKMWGRSAFIQAARDGDLDMVKYYFQHGAKLNLTDVNGDTALTLATKNKKYKVVQFLLKKGVDTSIVSEEGYNALEYAELTKHKKLIRLLKNGGMLDATKLDIQLAKKSAKPKYNSFALVIGISKYMNETEVDYADNSAKSFKLMAENILGVPRENIIYLTNEKATSGQIKSNVELISELVEKGSTLYFYFAGHGVPATDGKTYLLPSDMKADNIQIEKSLAITSIYERFTRSPAKEVIIFMDSCFSGKDDSGELLYKGVAPVLRSKKVDIDKSKLAVFSAGTSSDFANQYKDEEQRMFTYFVIKGLLEGKNSSDELYNYVKINVKRKSLRLGLSYKQVPQYNGKKALQIK